jgi:uncharacterized membrane protein
MHLSFQRYPIDIAIGILWALVLVPVVLFDVNETLRVILGLPAILFIPGYMLIFSLFPGKKTTKGIDTIERIALSFGLSIAVVPLIGLGLNYTPWGIRLLPILSSLVLFIITLGLISWVRWYKLSSDERFIITIDLQFPKNESRIDKALTIILAVSIVVSLIALVYVIVIPKTGETFTEFYILGKNGIADDYPRNMTTGVNETVIVGVVNHEYRPMNYTVELWAINQTLQVNTSTGENETIYHHMWFIDSQELVLEHVPIDIEGPWQPQWEKNWTFILDHTGTFKLAFLLYAEEQENYDTSIDYASIAERKTLSAYREVHLWVDVT